jgi:hypothetical protein
MRYFGAYVDMPSRMLPRYFPNLPAVDGCRDIVVAMSNKIAGAMRDSASPQASGDQSWEALLTGSKTLGHSLNRSTLNARRKKIRITVEVVN